MSRVGPVSTAGMDSSSFASREWAHAPRAVCMDIGMYIKARFFLNRLENYAFHEYIRSSVFAMSILGISWPFGFAFSYYWNVLSRWTPLLAWFMYVHGEMCFVFCFFLIKGPMLSNVWHQRCITASVFLHVMNNLSEDESSWQFTGSSLCGDCTWPNVIVVFFLSQSSGLPFYCNVWHSSDSNMPTRLFFSSMSAFDLTPLYLFTQAMFCFVQPSVLFPSTRICLQHCVSELRWRQTSSEPGWLQVTFPLPHCPPVSHQ